MAATTRVGSLKKHFRRLKDPRVVGRTKHLLFEIVALAICAVVGNCDDWADVVVFVEEREKWFRTFLKLPGGLPCRHTYQRVFDALDPRALESCCLAWLHEVAGLVGGVEHIAIDGKTLRGSAGSPLGALHLVSAWATGMHLTLGQVAVDGKSNEITAIPQLLGLLDLKGALVTIDAIGCQKSIAKQIVDNGGDYVLVAKGNQERLLADIQETVQQALDGELEAGATRQCTTTEKGHGRSEQRHTVIITDLTDIRDRKLWPKLTTVGMCYRERTVGDKTSAEACYFIGSRRMGARRYAQALRNHWGIENNQHWQLDVSFHEDSSRIGSRKGAANFALFRKMALNLLKRNHRQESIARKRKRAALDPAFLAETLAGANKLAEV
jgi:predicted transposase YbfD/YdcC